MVEDNPDNLKASPAAFKILMNRPWNNNDDGYILVNNMQEVKDCIDYIASAPIMYKQLYD